MMARSTTSLLFLLLFFHDSVVTTHSNSSDVIRSSPSVFRLGFLGAGLSATSRLRGALLAVEQVNEQGYLGDGNTMEMTTIRLGNCEAAHGTQSGRDFVVAGVHAVIGGGCSLISSASYLETSPFSIPQVAYSATSPVFDDKTQYPFLTRTCPSAAIEGKAIAAVLSKYSWQRIALVTFDEPYSLVIGTILTTQLQVTRPVLWEVLPQGSSDALRGAFGRIVSQHVSVVVVVALAEQAEPTMLAAAEAGFVGPNRVLLLGEDLTSGVAQLIDTRNMQLLTPEHQEMLRTVADGAIGLHFDQTIQNRRGRDFQALFQSKGYVEYDMPWTGYAYDAVWAIARAIRVCKKWETPTTGDALMSALQETAFFGAGGDISLLGDGTSIMLQFENVQWPFLRRVGSFSGNGSFSFDEELMKWPGSPTPPPAKLFQVILLCADAATSVLCISSLAGLVDANELDRLGASNSFNITVWEHTGCLAEDAESIGVALQLVRPHAIIGVLCSDFLQRLLDFVKVPIIACASTEASLGNSITYPNLLRTSFVDLGGVAMPSTRLVVAFGWRRVAVICSDDLWGTSSCRMAQLELNNHGVTVSQVRIFSAETASDLCQLVGSVTVIVVFESSQTPGAANALGQCGYFNSGGVIIDGNEYRLQATEMIESPHPTLSAIFTLPATMTPEIQAFLRATNGTILPTSTTTAGFDMAGMLAQGITAAFQAGVDPQLESTALMNHLRAVRFRGASGLVHYPQTGMMRNDRNGPDVREDAIMLKTQVGKFRHVGWLTPAFSQGPNLTASLIWPGNAPRASLACPRGTFGRLAESGMWYNCEPCPAGTHAAQVDSERCVPCDHGVCPFATPHEPYAGDTWIVEQKAVFPVPTLSLGTEEQRRQLRSAILIAVGLGILSSSLTLILSSLHFPCAQGSSSALRSIQDKLHMGIKMLDLFRRQHATVEGNVVMESRTLLGGFIGLNVCIGVLLAVVFVVASTAIDSVGVESYEIPGLLTFTPKEGISLTLYVVGADAEASPAERCAELCETSGDWFNLATYHVAVEWELLCFGAPDRGGCRVEAQPKVAEGTLLPSEFWLGLNLPQTRVHGFQWIVRSTFREDGTEYLTSGNITAPNGEVFVGEKATEVHFSLQPTIYEARQRKDQGYVPFSLLISQGSTATSETWAHIKPGSFLSSAVFKFQVLTEYRVVFVEKSVSTLSNAASQILTLARLVIICGMTFLALCELVNRLRGQLKIRGPSNDFWTSGVLQEFPKGRSLQHNSLEDTMEDEASASSFTSAPRSGNFKPVLTTATLCFASVCLVFLLSTMDAHPSKHDTTQSLFDAFFASEREPPSDLHRDDSLQAVPVPRVHAARSSETNNLRSVPNPNLHLGQLHTPRAQVFRVALWILDVEVGAREGFLLAINEINSGGYLGNGDFLSVSLMLSDDCTAAGGNSAGIAFREANVDAILGGACSIATQASYTLTEALGIPQISYSVKSPAFDNATQYPLFFRSCPSGQREVDALVATLLHFKWGRIGIMASREPYSAALADSVEAALRSTVCQVAFSARWDFNSSSSSIQPVFLAAKQEGIAVTLIIDQAASVASVLVAAYDAGMYGIGTATILSSSLIQGLQRFRNSDAVGTEVEQKIAAVSDGSLGFISTTSSERTLQFHALWSATRLGMNPSPFGAWAYDAAWAFARAILICKTRGQPVQGEFLARALNSIAFTGASGDVMLPSQSSASFALSNVAWPFFRTVGTWARGKLRINSASVQWAGAALAPPSAQIYKIALICDFDVSSPSCGSALLGLQHANAAGLLGDDRVEVTVFNFACVGPLTSETLLQFTSSQFTAILSGACWSQQRQLSVVTPRTPTVNCITWGVEFGDSSRFPFLVKTQHPDPVQSKGIAALIWRLGWRRIGGLFIASWRNSGTVRFLEGAFDATGVTFESFFVSSNGSAVEDEIRTFAQRHQIIVAFENTVETVYADALRSLGFFRRGGMYLDLDALWRDTQSSNPILSARLSHVLGPDFADYSEMYQAWRPNHTKPDGIAAACWDAASVLVKSMQRLKQESVSPHDASQLMRSIRMTDFQGASNRMYFPGGNALFLPSSLSYDIIHNPVGNFLVKIGRLNTNDSGLDFFHMPGWSGGAERAPIACPRGTYGRPSSQGPWYQCEPCPAGTYAAQVDSAKCERCSEGVCPFASPHEPYEGEWTVPQKAVFPVPTLSLGTSAERQQYAFAIFIPAGLLVLGIVSFATLIRVARDFKFVGTTGKAFCEAACRGFQRCDLFSRRHSVPLNWPLIQHSTQFGGVATVSCLLLCAACFVYVFYVGFEIDGTAVEGFTTPGVLVFRPQGQLYVTIFTVSSDAGSTSEACEQVCKKLGGTYSEGSKNMLWQLSCFPAPARRGCRVEAQPKVAEGVLFPSEFWLDFHWKQTRVHGFQWVVRSKFRGDGTEYMTSGNITAASGTILGQAAITFQLAPTIYSEKSGTKWRGYTPFALQSDKITLPESYFFTHDGAGFEGASLRLAFGARRDRTLEFKEKSTVNNVAVVTEGLALCLTCVLATGILLRFTERITARMRGSEMAVQPRYGRKLNVEVAQSSTADTCHHERRPVKYVGVGVTVVGLSACLVLGLVDSSIFGASRMKAPIRAEPVRTVSNVASPGPFSHFVDAQELELHGFSSYRTKPDEEIVSNKSGAESSVLKHQPIARNAANFIVGFLADQGSARRQSLDLALSHVRSAGILGDGDTLSVVYQEDLCNFESGQAAGLAFAAANVRAVVGGKCSPTTLGSYSILGPMEVPHVSYSATSQVFENTTQFPFFARTCPSAGLSVSALVSLVDFFQWQRVAILSSDDSYPVASALALKSQLETKLIVPEYFSIWERAGPNAAIEEHFSRIRDANLNILILFGWNTGFDLNRLANAAYRVNVSGVVCILSQPLSQALEVLMDTPEQNLVELRALFDGSLGVAYSSSDAPRMFHDYHFSFAALGTGIDPSPWGGYAYDAVWALARAIRQCKSWGLEPTGHNLMTALKGLQFMGASGEVEIGDPAKARGEMAVLNYKWPHQAVVGRYENLGRKLELSSDIFWPQAETTVPSSKIYRIGVICFSAADDEACRTIFTSLQLANNRTALGQDRFEFQAPGLFHANVCSEDEAPRVAAALKQARAHVVVGNICSAMLIRMLPLLEIPVISTPRLQALENITNFPNFLRMMELPERFPCMSLVRAFGWQRVALACSTDPYGEENCRAASEWFSNFAIVHTVWKFPHGATRENLRDIAERISGTASVVVVFESSFSPALASALIDAQFFSRNGVILEGSNVRIPTTPALGWVFPIDDSNPLFREYVDHTSPQIPLLEDAASFDQALLLVHGIRAMTAAGGDVQKDPAGFMQHLRAVDFQGASGRVRFKPHSNDRVAFNQDHFRVWSRATGSSLDFIGTIDPVNNILNFSDVPEWSGGAERAPIACPRGTYGRPSSQGPWYQCEPCPAGTYAAQVDSAKCERCSEGVCPFASPHEPYEGEWTVPQKAVFPVPARTLGTSAERQQYAFAIFIPAGLLVLGILVLALVVHFSLAFDKAMTPFVGGLIRRAQSCAVTCDVFFASRHRVPQGWPVSRFQTYPGGVTTVACVVTAIAISLYVLTEGAIIDSKALESYEVPGLLTFHPHHRGSFALTLYVIGVDSNASPAERCADICRSSGDWINLASHHVEWELLCFGAPDRGGCRVEAQPKLAEGQLLPSEFWLGLRMQQTRVHGFQWIVRSTFREDGTEYLTSGNVTAPDGMTLMGHTPSQVWIKLQPTSYILADGNHHDGYVPFTLNSKIGDTKGVADYFYMSSTNQGSATFRNVFNLTFSVPREFTDAFAEKNLFSLLTTGAQFVILASAVFSVGGRFLWLFELIQDRRNPGESLRRQRMRQHLFVAPVLGPIVGSPVTPVLQNESEALSDKSVISVHSKWASETGPVEDGEAPSPLKTPAIVAWPLPEEPPKTMQSHSSDEWTEDFVDLDNDDASVVLC